MDNPLVTSRQQLAAAEKLRKSNNPHEAKRTLENLLKTHPDYYAALHTLGLIESSLGNFNASFSALARAHAICPESSITLTALAGVHLKLGSRQLARDCIEASLRIASSDPNNLLTLAEILREEREYEEALEAYKECLRLEPSWREASLAHSIVLESVGRDNEAVEIVSEIVRRNPNDLDAILILCGIPSAHSVLNLEEYLRNATRSLPEREEFHFAWAAIYEQKKDYQKSFELTQKANRPIAKKNENNIQINRRWQNDSLSFVRRFEINVGPVEDANLPISLFVLGASRSGKTTAESILSKLPGTKRGYENPSALNALKKTFLINGFIAGTQYSLLPPPLEKNCRDWYARDIKDRADGAEIFTNTSPARIHDALRMSFVLPNTRFLFVKRDRYDTALRIFQKNYSSGNYYSYTLKSALEHVDWYHDMIDVLLERLPGRTACVEYENFVGNEQVLFDALTRVMGAKPIVASQTKSYDDTGASRPYRDLMERELQA